MSKLKFPLSLNQEEIKSLGEMATRCRGDILTMTTLAASGHPGGSMSSIDILLTIYKYANISPDNFNDNDKDRVIVSIGHISPGVYSCLGRNGFFFIDDAISQFRLAGSIYEGHIERDVNGVEWTTGNLGQGLSAGCGMALANKRQSLPGRVFVLMGDGEQQKGQISEARRFAVQHGLSNLTAIIDCNCLQISGDTSKVMRVNIAAEYAAAGWNVLEISGHDYSEISAALAKADASDTPTLIIAQTVMGKGVSFMENKHGFHGSALPEDKYILAMQELGLKNQIEKYKELRKAFKPKEPHKLTQCEPTLPDTERYYYKADASTDCRSASGKAMYDLVAASVAQKTSPVLIFDCDLAGSIKTTEIERDYPSNFIQCGISEHSSCAAAGAAGAAGVIPFFTGFAMFSVDEVYNQLRMNDINYSNLKVISTHAGVDVGEDGRTHQCVDYLGLLRNLFGYKVITPADPNQTDSAVHYAARVYGNVHVIMGRSKVPVIKDEKGKPLFGEDYEFEYGKIDEVRLGGDCAILSYGVMLYRALKVRELLAAKGIDAAVYNVSTPLYLNYESQKALLKHKTLFVLEDHISDSGLYSTICTMPMESDMRTHKVIGFGVPRYSQSGKPDEVYRLIGLDPLNVAERIAERVGK